MATPIPSNRAPFSLEEVVRATGAEVVARGPDEVVGVSTDSRADLSGKIFVALVGEHFDGHDYAGAAVEQGAAALLVSRRVELGSTRASVLAVPDTLVALGELAHWHRRRWGGRVLAVGGSAGKTTTRAVASALASEVVPGRVHFAPGNLNNLVGVPMVLLGLGPEHEFGMVEIGTNQTGEVDRLTRMVEPDVAVLTLVALEHTAGLGDLDQIEAEEGSLLALLPPDGAAVANGNDLRAVRQLDRSPARRRVRYGTGGLCDYRLLGRTQRALDRVQLELSRATETFSVESPLLGEAGALAVLGGLGAVESLLGDRVEPAALERALRRREIGEPGRLVPMEFADGTVLLDDTYNANPASVRASLRTAAEIAAHQGARLVLVIGEMRELGAFSEREHRELGHELARTGASCLCAIGGDASHLVGPAAARGMVAHFEPDVASALPWLERQLLPRDVVLVKASRGIGAERVVARLAQVKGVPA